MLSASCGEEYVAVAPDFCTNEPPDIPPDSLRSLSGSASTGESEHVNRGKNRSEKNRMRVPARNIKAWDVHFANELESHCQQISVEVKEHCDKLVAMIAEKALMGDIGDTRTQKHRLDDGSRRTRDSPQGDHRDEELCQGPHENPVHMESSIRHRVTSERAHAIILSEAAAGNVDAPVECGAISANLSTYTTTPSGMPAGAAGLAVEEKLEAKSTGATVDPYKSRKSLFGKAQDWCHAQIEHVANAGDASSSPSKCQQLLACIFPCFFKLSSSSYMDTLDVDVVGDDMMAMQHVQHLPVFKHQGQGFKARVARVVGSQSFDMMVGWLIILNCFVMVVQCQHYGYEAKISLQMIADDGSWANADEWFGALEHGFNALFITELSLRFFVFRWHIFRECSNILDCWCVLVSSTQLYILDPFASVESGGNFTLFRLLRLLRFVRVMRIVRIMSVFSELRVLVKTCISSLEALAWSMIVLFIIMVVAGLLLCEFLKGYIKDSSKDVESRKWVYKHYGTALRAVYTLFEVTLAGCWPNYFRPLIHDVSPFFAGFAVIYITFVVFAIIRIITALFLKQTLYVASRDADMMVSEQLRARQRYIEKLRSVFKAIDVSGDGKLDLVEFKWIAEHPEIKTWLQMLELEVHDVDALFRLLDDGDGELSYDEFLSGILRMKGQARSIDVVSIMRTSDKTLEIVKSMQDQLQRM